ncbi:MAG: alpha/beta fold hydrolase [Rhodobacteraceae bacterium]|nr:alpha/beta fold hydrolase [Paracoccaceae bacterium]
MREPLVFLPGMMCDVRLFAPQIAAFSLDRSVMFVPLKGEATIAGLARRVLEQSPPRFALAGLSMGGIVAMEVIRQAPDRVQRLALMDTNPFADPPEMVTVRALQADRVRNGELRAVMRDEMKPKYLANGSEKGRILGLCMDMAEELGSDVFRDQSHAIRHRPDQCGTLREIAVPSLVLCGEEDRLCPVERHELMHDLITGSRLAIIAGAGHMPTLEQPEKTNEELRHWLRM